MSTRQPTAIDRLADRFFADQTAMSPIWLTTLGSTERQDEYDDLSPAGLDAYASLVTSTLASLDALTPADGTDVVTLAAMRERLGLDAELHAAHADLAQLNNLECGLLSLREVYDLMPTSTPEQWATIARRLRAIPDAADGWFASQLAGLECGIAPARRQVEALAEECRQYAGPRGYFADLSQRATRDCPGLPASVGEALEAGIATAREAYLAAASRLETELLPRATSQDAVGPERYQLASRRFLGTRVDYAATYQWGLDEVARLEAAQETICARLRPGLSVRDTKLALDADPAYQLHGTDALRTWMQGKADEAIAALDGVHFDIRTPARTIQCMIADTHEGGIWYTPPSDDFTRPGRMWWSVPDGETTFGTWRELTTVYHEGTPGHHLQCAAAILARDELNTWRRNGIWVSGHGEGWALYAETLMAELGFLDDPAMLLGQMDGEQMRAVRVVIDMGVHCGFTAPDEVGGGEWTYDKAWDYFNRHVNQSEGQARFEVMRYFGWAGQAPAYKIGHRAWLELRDAARTRDGAAFSLKDFHARALALGSLGLDTLREAVLAS
ncbi:MAG: DUF885 domain-containing protein [Actinomycetia bacterium]|nr:DUF885 domain-containing protein [Actinomycetes bacterium]